MSLRNDDLDLTPEQREIKDKFALWINGSDRGEKLIDFIDQLGEIPDHVSPIRILAQENHDLVGLFINSALERAKRDALQAESKNQAKFIEKGSRSQFSLKSSTHFLNSFIRLITPIYRNAVYGCALIGESKKVDEMLKNYERWLHHDFSKQKNTLLEIIYKFAFEGYSAGEHHQAISALWERRKITSKKLFRENILSLTLVVKSLAIVGHVDAVSELICDWSSFQNTEASLAIIAAATLGYTEGNHVFELQRLQATQIIMNEVNSIHPSQDDEKRKEKIVELINGGLNLELRKSLLIDCIYKGTVLGSEMWFKCAGLFVQTPSLKRGQLNIVLKKLIELGVDVSKLPGCSDYSAGWIEVTTKYPSKVNLLGLWPHSDPAIAAAQASERAEELEDDSASEQSRAEAKKALLGESLMMLFEYGQPTQEDDEEKRSRALLVGKKR